MAEQNSPGQNLQIFLDWILWISGIAIGGLLACSFAAVSQLGWQGWQTGIRVFGLGVLLSLAAAASGALLGFLFGIPKAAPTSDETGKSGDAQTNAAKAQSTSKTSQSRPNTNLEQISDWLTKIIVGITLVEFNSIRDSLVKLVHFLNREGFDWANGGQLLGFAIIILFAPLGFMCGYVVTRTFLTGLFDAAQTALRDAVEAVNAAELGPQPSKITVLTANEKQSMSAMLGTDPKTLSGSDELAAFATAKFVAGDLNTAKTYYEQALVVDPKNLDVQRRLGMVHWALGDRSQARDLVNEARRNALAAGDSVAAGKASEYLVFTYLYDHPKGFEKAIDAGTALEASSSEQPTPWLNVLLAAAYGQQHADLQKSDSPNPELIKKARENALSRVRSAARNPDFKRVLQEIWNPALYHSDPAENDLESFKDDPDFKALLGN
jgi:tetratricopeptide (TPR) repeat protein